MSKAEPTKSERPKARDSFWSTPRVPRASPSPAAAWREPPLVWARSFFYPSNPRSVCRLKNVKTDLTEDRLFTISDGTAKSFDRLMNRSPRASTFRAVSPNSPPSNRATSSA